MPYRNSITEPETNRPIKILHVGVGMVKGGLETWIMQILGRNNREQVQMDFVVHTADPCPYDDQVRAFGSRIIPCPYTANPWLYGYHFKRILYTYGSYDVVHSHSHCFSGYILRLAKQAGVPIRIAHSHFDFSAVEAQASLYRRLYLALTRRWIKQYATLGLGGSQRSMVDLFGSDWKADARWQILPYGIDLKPFREPIDPVAIRDELGIPQDALVIGHVGRFVEEKNHTFLLDIVAEVIKQEPKAHLLLVGEGKLQPAIQEKVIRLGFPHKVTFAGIRSDIPRLMRGAIDIFLFPSLCEGLGLVLLEAQAAGLQCTASDGIPIEANVVNSLVHRLSLSQSPTAWAECLLAQRYCPKLSQDDALAILESSPFNAERSLQQLEEIYQTQWAKTRSKTTGSNPMLLKT